MANINGFFPHMTYGDQPVPVSPEEWFTWSIIDAETIELTGFAAGYEDTAEIHIPSTAQGRSVVSIGNSAFEGASSLEYVEIPGSVTSLGTAAFRNCASLATVVLNEGLETIGNNAFAGTSSAIAPKITEITLPSTLTAMAMHAFRYCPNLLNVNFLGNAPSASDPYFGTQATLTSYAPTGATGWPTGTPPLTWQSRPFEYV